MKIEEPAIKYKFPMSPEEFLQWERESDTKHEYIHGEVISMAEASFVHNTILSNVIVNVGHYLKGKSCHIYPSDLRVSANDARGTYYYPDATIICGEPEFSDGDKDSVINPAVIFEVLSPSTGDYDLGKKFFSYMEIASLKQYITIRSTGILVRSGVRNPNNTWSFETFSELEKILSIHSTGQKLPLSDIYENISFPPLP